MSDLDLHDAYERFGLSPDADQEEIRRAYLQLRQELDGEDLRLLYAAWEHLWSPQNRVRVDALGLQADRKPATVDELLAEIEPTAGADDWDSFIDSKALIQQEAASVTSLILERTWLGHAYNTLFGREKPVLETHPLPQPTLTPTTRAARPATAEDLTPIEAGRRPQPRFRPVLAGALMAAMALTFVLWRGGWLNLSAVANLSPSLSSQQSVTWDAPLTVYNAPSLAFIVPTATPYGQLPGLMAQSMPRTPPPALTAPITSAQLIDQLRERLEQSTELVETNESEFARNIAVGAVRPAIRLPLAPRPSAISPQPTPQERASPPATPEPTQTATPSPTATPVPVTVQSRTYTNVRSGPGSDFDVLEVLAPEVSRSVLARTQSAAWLQIETTNGERGWVSTAVVDVVGDVGGIEVLD